MKLSEKLQDKLFQQSCIDAIGEVLQREGATKSAMFILTRAYTGKPPVGLGRGVKNAA